MSVIDKSMYEKLKKWCDWKEGCRPINQQILYVSSHDRALTNATIRKLMFEMKEEDVHGDLYIAFYSAENFYRNMRDYYLEIARLYMNKPNEDDPLIDIIEDYPATCGWLMLIVEDIEALSKDEEKMKEVLKTFLAFASKGSRIILIENGDFEDDFSRCDYALQEMTEGLAVKEEDNQFTIGYYDQGMAPDEENVIHETIEKQRDELNYYWDTLYSQLGKGYFDYFDFKLLFEETLEYLIPRVTIEQVYRKDLLLIEHIGAMRFQNHGSIEGCRPWEFESAQKFAVGLHEAIVNEYGDNDELSGGTIGIEIGIEEPSEDYGAIHVSGSMWATIKVSVVTVCSKMDRLSEAIHKCTYEGDATQAWKFLDDNHNEDDATL